MKWLLWREYRANLHLLIAGVVLFFLPYFFILVMFLWSPQIADGFAFAALVSFALSQMTITLLGGNAIAGERADRTAEFLAYLPVSKTRRLVGKLCLTASVTALVWGINLLVFGILAVGDPDLNVFRENPDAVVYPGLTGLVMFGVAWCISSIQSSPTIAVCGGIATPVIILNSLWLVTINFDLYDKQFFANWYTMISITLGALGFAVGTWCYLKRVEP
jgi:ABC-type transport system involved in multi-copper enzyme maturation permease subunit